MHTPFTASNGFTIHLDDSCMAIRQDPGWTTIESPTGFYDAEHSPQERRALTEFFTNPDNQKVGQPFTATNGVTLTLKADGSIDVDTTRTMPPEHVAAFAEFYAAN